MIILRSSMGKLSVPIFTVAISALSLCLMPSDLHALAFVRWILGTIFILFLPGYILGDVLLSKEEVSFPDRLMMGFAFSVIIVAVLGYSLNQLPWGINRGTVLSSLSLLMFGSVLIRIACERGGGQASPREQAFAFARGLRMYHTVALIFIIILGIFVRLIPYVKIGTFLDLDPYNHYMKINAILIHGRIPTFDSLSLAPQGTSATYTITPLGFELLVVALETTTQAPLIELMGLLPVLYAALTILAMFSFCYETTESSTASLLTAFFSASSTSWLLVYGVSMNPVAENIGLYLFPLGLLYLARYIRTSKKCNIVCSAILFGTMFYIHFFTVIYFVLTLAGYAFISFLIDGRRKTILKGVIYTFFLGSLLSLPILFQTVTRSARESIVFSETVFELACASDSYVTLLPQDLPQIISFPLLYLTIIALSVTILTIAVRTVSRILRKKQKIYRRNLLPFSWCLSLLLVGFIHLIEPLRNVLVVLPLSGALIAAHRIVPYLTLASYILAAITVTDHISRLFTKVFNPTLKFPNRFVQRSFIVFLMITVLVISVNYTGELASWPNSRLYDDFFTWVKENTRCNDVFLANNWEMSMWLRAVGERPTVFSHVHQDLVSQDAKERMRLHTMVFDDSFYDEAVQMLKEYNVSYVVVTAKANYVDIVNKRWIWSIPDLKGYTEEMDSRGYLKRAFTGDDIWVYIVDKSGTTYCYSLNVTNSRNFVGNGWSVPYNLTGVDVKNATRGYVGKEWRFSDFFIPLSPKRDSYSLEVEYFDIESSSHIMDLLTQCNDGLAKIGSLYVNGTFTFKRATFTLTKELFFDYYENMAGFQQYFVIGSTGTYDLPVSRIVLREQVNYTEKG